MCHAQSLNEFLTAGCDTITIEVFIAIRSADPNTDRSPDNERGELLRQIETSSIQLEGQLAELRHGASGHPDLLANGQARLHRLNSLRDQLVGGAKGVAALRAEITAAVAATHAYTLSVSGVVGTAQASPAEQAAQAALRDASIAARQTVNNFERDFYGRKIFDPYLKFASADDEEEYRRREAERQRAIETARAENTPEGNLRAINLSIDQMNDAGAHGADRSADFKPMLDGLKKSKRELAAHLQSPGRAQPSEPAQADAKPDTTDLNLPPDVIARLRAANVVAADPNQQGHGVASRATTTNEVAVRQ